MRIEVDLQIPSVPTPIHTPLQGALNTVQRHRLIIPDSNIILRTDMHESQQNWRQLRHRIRLMRDTKIAALIRNVAANLAAPNARLAECVELDVIAVVAELRGGEDGDGTAETMADGNNLVGRVGVSGGFDGGKDALSGLGPGGVEASEGMAAGADVGRVDEREAEVREVVADGAGAAEGDDDEVIGAVGGDEAGNVGDEGAGGELLV